MPYCPKCRAEFREGFDRCSKCDVDLVESLAKKELSEDEKERATRHKVKPQPEMGNEIPLVVVDSQVELLYITAELEAADIAYRVMEQGMGQYLTIYMGISYTGKTIYIDKNYLDKASDIVKSYKAKFEAS